MAIMSSGITSGELGEMKDKLGLAASSDKIITLKDITIPYDSDTKSYDYTNDAITPYSFCQVHYINSDVAMCAEVRTTKQANGTLHFTFEQEPTEPVTCVIVVMNP